jgi:pyridoxine/pyridoxamine 5'-phosphate oxidase
MPGYGLSDQPVDPAIASWANAQQKLTDAHNYWIATTSGEGQPHAMPVWGLWIDGAFLFSTGRNAHKGRDLAANPKISVHLESGDDVVILEGTAEELTEQTLPAGYADAYEAKYRFRPNTSDPADATYAVRPHVAFTWLEANFVESAARWRFQR